MLKKLTKKAKTEKKRAIEERIAQVETICNESCWYLCHAGLDYYYGYYAIHIIVP
jgi:hypothetical protein